MKDQVELLNDVNVIITTRNRIGELLITIQKCLEIGLQQKQLFITDDASTDGTPEQLASAFPEVVLHVNKTQKGYIHNRNLMMRGTGARFILSLDDDSNLLSRADLQEALGLLDSNEHYGVFGFVPIEQTAPVQSVAYLGTKVYISQWYIGCGHIIKRSTLDAIGFYREEYIFYGEEVDFSIRCFKEGLLVVCKENLVVHHRVDYSQRKVNVRGDLDKGEYGILWRSELAMANRLTNILIHYPSPLVIYYFLKVLTGFFLTYVLKNKWFRCYWSALTRVSKRAYYIKRARSPLTLVQFREYIKLHA